MINLDLFAWWSLSITSGTIFLTMVSIYIYIKRSAKRKEISQTNGNLVRLLKDFVFVWVLLGLLIFYIASIKIGSATIFAAGNILVEAILIIYLMKSKHEKSE